MNNKTRIACLTLICFFLFSSNVLFGQDWSAEQKEVWAKVEGLWQAMAEGDYNKFASFFGKDFRGWRDDWQAPHTLKSFQPWMERWLKNNKYVLYDIHPLAIDIHGNVAIVFWTWQEVLEHKDGSDMFNRGKWTSIFQKTDGKWLIIGETGFDITSSANE